MGHAVQVVAVPEHSVHGDVQERQFWDPSIKNPVGQVQLLDARVKFVGHAVQLLTVVTH